MDISSGVTISTQRLDSLKTYWDDQYLMDQDRMPTGLGEQGKAAFLTDPLEIQENEKLFKEYGMSLLISDKM